MNSDAGRVLNARNAKQVATSPSDTAARSSCPANAASPKIAAAPAVPTPTARPSTLPRPSTAWVTSTTSRNARQHVERLDAGGPEPGTGDHRDDAAGHGGEQGEPVGAAVALRERTDRGQRDRARARRRSVRSPGAVANASPTSGPSATSAPERRRMPRRVRSSERSRRRRCARLARAATGERAADEHRQAADREHEEPAIGRRQA